MSKISKQAGDRRPRDNGALTHLATMRGYLMSMEAWAEEFNATTFAAVLGPAIIEVNRLIRKDADECCGYPTEDER